ncbi:sensor histidine kinase [Falsibacillus albus]|uniref:histidine kinase n=1 Tax=Falsibacillus albus TaxID=2478915 RepID=A0A3L7JUF8_9BACI|nr:HAMP domain-containing sensor histidine kinase [Falsibacillus albus]RLQ94537.1 sensor histidine kinase [Falsibacillus albus]
MKLKYKLPLIFSILIILFVSLSAFYIRIDVSQVVLTRINQEVKKLDAGNQAFVDNQVRLHPNRSSLEASVKKEAKAQQMNIFLYDQTYDHVLVTAEGTKRKNFLYSHLYPVRDQAGRIAYFMKIERPLSIKALVTKTIFTKSFVLFLILLCLIFVVLFLYFQHYITRPIERLNERLSAVSLSKSLPALSSDRKDEIGELYTHVKEMEERIYETQAEQVNMVGAIAHDLKTPLTSINGFLELIQMQKDLSQAQKEEYLQLIHKKSRHITQLVDEFSLYSKNEIALQKLQVKPVKMASFFENIAEEYEAELSGLDYELHWKHTFSPNDEALLNETMIRRVFGNLFSNIVRYGGKDLSGIYLKGFIEKHKAILTLEDNGMGVPKGQLPFIFQKFFTVDKSRQREYGGTGLGLASCKSIIERHGGSIDAFQSTHGGLGIKIGLPLVRNEE